MISKNTKFLLAGVVAMLTIVAIKGDKNESVAMTLDMMLVRTLQNQLKTCMDQNADLVRRTCRAKDEEKGYPGQQIHRYIAFHAGLSKNIENLPHNYKVIFDHIYLNEGKGYDPHTGVFTCPVDGIYAFDWTITTKAGKYFTTDFMVNGKIIVRSYPHGASVNIGVSSMVVQKLKKGDKAWIEPQSPLTGLWAFGGWCFFSGFKI